MEKNKIKMNSVTYGAGIFITMLILAFTCLILGVVCFPNKTSIVLLVAGVFFVICTCLLIYFKYINYITINNKTLSTKNRTLSWNEVCITFSYYVAHLAVRKSMHYYLFFDDHYLSEEEIYSRRVKKDAFYLMVTPQRLDIILKKYSKKIQLLERCPIDKKGLYDKICQYNESIITNSNEGN